MRDNSASKSINRQIIALAFPAIVNNITVPLLGLCDTAIAGHLGSAVFLGAMAVGSTMLNVLFWLCGFLRMGTSGLTAQAFGAGNITLMRDVIRKALSIGMVIALILLCLQQPLLHLFLKIISPEPEVSGFATLYFNVAIWSAPAQLGIMACSGWFIGCQNTVVPMAVAIGVNVINILLSLLFVFGFNLGFAGIPYGTLCASWIGLFVIIALVRNNLRRKASSAVSADERSRIPWKRFFSVSSDLFFRSACIMCVTLAMTSVGARLGETTLACNAVIMQFFLFFSYFMDGFAFAGEALVGKAVGSQNVSLQRDAVKGLLNWGAAMAIAFFLIYFFFTPAITGLLTNESSVISSVSDIKFMVFILPPITVAAFIFDGIYIGMAKTRPLLVTTIVATLVFFGIVIAKSLNHQTPSNILLWCAFDLYLFLRGLQLGIIYPKYKLK